MKYLLISTDRVELDITTSEHKTMKEAHDAMLKEILELSDYETEEELITASDDGEAGYEEDEAWISDNEYDTIVWKIVKV